MRTRSNIHVLSGHRGTVAELKCQDSDPQVITASLDSTVRMWDLAAGKTMGVLTHHKKGVRALALHPTEFTFATGSTGSIKHKTIRRLAIKFSSLSGCLRHSSIGSRNYN